MQKFWLEYNGKKHFVNAPIKINLIQMQQQAKKNFTALNKIEPSTLLLQCDNQQIKTKDDYSRRYVVTKLKKIPEVTFKVKKPAGQIADQDQDDEEEVDSEKSIPDDDDQDDEQSEEGEDVDSNEEVKGSEQDRDSDIANVVQKKTQKRDPSQDSEVDSNRKKEDDQEESEQQEQAKPQDNDSQQEEEQSQQKKHANVKSEEQQDPEQSEQDQAIDNNSKPAEPKQALNQDSEVEHSDQEDQQLSESSEEQEESEPEDKPEQQEQVKSDQDPNSDESSQPQSEPTSQRPAAQVVPDSQDQQHSQEEEIEQPQLPAEENHQKPIEASKINQSVNTEAITKPKVTETPKNQLKTMKTQQNQVQSIKDPARKGSIQKEVVFVGQEIIERVNKSELQFIQMQKNMILMQERLAKLQREKESQPAQQIVLTGCNGCGFLKSKVTRKKIGTKQLNIVFCDECDSQFEITLKEK